jgi:small subunit ribosomal protein S4
VIVVGKPKFSSKKYETPSHPWQEDRIKEENELIKKYGLKNKREVWKAETVLRKYRGQTRELLAKIGGDDPQIKKESDQLLMHLTRLNILPPNSTLDDVLALETESILARRLQTLTYLKGLANTPVHARQLISHGHIAIAGRKTTVPGYMVTKDEENEIGYVVDSPLNDELHPMRPSADFKSVPIKKEEKPEKLKKEEPKAEEKKEKDIEEKPPQEEPSSEKKEGETPQKEEPGEPEKQKAEEPTESEEKSEEKTEVENEIDVKKGEK